MKSLEPEFIVIGTVLSLWGANGQLKVDVETDFPQRFSPSSQVYINRQPMVIDAVEWHKGKAIIKLDTIDNAEDAQELSKQMIEIHHSQLYELPEGEYFHFQLIGLKVKTDEGELLGEIKEIITTAGTDVYVINGERGEILIPATDEIVKSIDLDNGYLVIEPLSGLLNLNEKKAK